jgi:serine/threonine protein kinase
MVSQDNIFTTPSRKACIADFGLSSIITSISSIPFTHSSRRAQGGTARYQAPELHLGGHNDQKSDIYGFACVVYEVCRFSVPSGHPIVYINMMRKAVDWEGSIP